MPKFLIIRFSSIGDIIQCMGVVGGIKNRFPDAEIHWVTRKDFSQILAIDKRIDKVWAFDKALGFGGLLDIAKELKKERFDYIYDAHSNIRSNVLKLCLSPFSCVKPYVALRSKDRWKRFLLFKFGVNKFDRPFRSMVSFQTPLNKWGITNFDDNTYKYIFPEEFTMKFSSLIDEKTVTLVPSANWEMKRWPVDHWKKLIQELPSYKFIVLGGPNDKFCEELYRVAPDRVTNLSGKTSLLESCYIVWKSKVVVSADTGFLHAADLFKIPTLALMGPTAFGFPSAITSQIVEVDLSCRPCTKDGRGGCKKAVYQQCMVDIQPKDIASRIIRCLASR